MKGTPATPPLALLILMLLTLATGCGTGPGLGPTGPQDAGEAAHGVHPRATIYLVREGRLHPVRRDTSAETEPTRAAAEALRLLLLGPAPRERQSGLTSLLPHATLSGATDPMKFVTVQRRGDDLIVRLPFNPAGLPRLGLGQLVCTASTRAPVTLTHDGTSNSPHRCTDFPRTR